MRREGAPRTQHRALAQTRQARPAGFSLDEERLAVSTWRRQRHSVAAVRVVASWWGPTTQPHPTHVVSAFLSWHPYEYEWDKPDNRVLPAASSTRVMNPRVLSAMASIDVFLAMSARPYAPEVVLACHSFQTLTL